MSQRTPAPRVDVRVATSAADLVLARAIFREYAASLPFSLCFQGFEEELATLPGKYAAPTGEILIAYDDLRPLGCAAVRPIDAMPDDPADARPVCEMKRLYVKPAARGLGVGRALCERLIADARAMGYRMMKLDSEPDFDAAVGLYRSLGFVTIPRYNDDPHPQTIYLGLRL
jgi:putative acetyltransferase